MLTIRLSRVGKKKQPEYRLIINEKTKDPWGDVLEYLGYYNPRTKPATIKFEVERIKYWLSKGAQVSDTVKNILLEQKILEGEKKLKPRGIKNKKAEVKSEEKNSENKQAEKKEVPVEAKSPDTATLETETPAPATETEKK